MDFRPTPPARLLPMTFKKIWFQLHWFVGITAGTVLIVIGLSGAVFSFHEEILGWMNPGTASVPARNAAPLAPPQVAQALREAGEQRVVQRITVFAEPGRSAQDRKSTRLNSSHLVIS